jgi:hypothetical protein
MADGDLGPLDKMYRDTNIVILIIFSLCCGIIAFILNLIGFVTAKDPTAKKNAKLALFVNIGAVVVIFLFYFVLGGVALLGGAAK